MKKAITVKDLMGETGMAKQTICLAIQKRGWSKPGVKTVLTREQADQIKNDLIANATQYKTGEGNKALSRVSGTVQGALDSDPRMRAIILAEDIRRTYEALLQCKDEIIADLQAENRKKEVFIEHTRRGLETYQRIAEAAGLVRTDREDLLDTYRR